MEKKKRLLNEYRFPGFRPKAEIKGIFGDAKARVIRFVRSQKTVCGCCGVAHRSYYDKKVRWVRDLSCGEMRIYLEVEIRRVQCRRYGKVKTGGVNRTYAKSVDEAALLHSEQVVSG
ncbi:conserved hypothetical protein [Candidatus Brocadia pituitae]|nr:conserved hypothetical protein [Candidatus Brocadia pituitae]